MGQRVQAVEKQLQVYIGAKHRCSQLGEKNPKDQTPSLYQQGLNIERLRQRVTHLEQVTGNSAAVQLLKQVQVKVAS